MKIYVADHRIPIIEWHGAEACLNTPALRAASFQKAHVIGIEQNY
jgi:hypothetical protein